ATETAPGWGTASGTTMLQWSRRANATETWSGWDCPVREPGASMEPSRERDGDLPRPCGAGLHVDGASMEPSRERDGDDGRLVRRSADGGLQWSRRANATETS